jgi:hypothetical protein
MRRFALFVSAVTLLVPATASAAPFGEVPSAPVSGSATCLRATGAPGELMRSSPTGARFLTATAAGIADAGVVSIGNAEAECPQVAARPDGAGVVAQAGAGLWVATREPGGAWGAPAKLAQEASRAAVAVADSGAAVVAWLERNGDQRFTVKVARRAAGGAFSPTATLGTGRSSSEYAQQGSVQAAIAADGEAIVTWTQPPPDEETLRMPVLAAIAPAAGAFGTPQRIGETLVTSAPVLAQEPGGRALAAFWNGTELRVAERAPGAAFAAAATVARVNDAYVTMPAVALAPGGAAVVGWYSLLGQQIGAVARPAAGAFGTPVTLASGGPSGLSTQTLSLIGAFGFGELFGPIGVEGVDPDGEGGNLRAAITAEGGALLTWNGFAGGYAGHAATFPLAGGHLDRWRLGAQVRSVSSIVPVTLANGARAVAWTENDSESERAGVMHLAVEGAVAAPDAPAPAVTLGRPRDSVLKPDDSLDLPISCSAACDVRVDLPDRFGTGEFISLPAAGRRTVSIEEGFGPIAPQRRGPVRVRLRFAAPGARTASERIETVTLRGVPRPRTPRVLGLRAVRHGSTVDVTWRTDIAAQPDRFAVLGSDTRTGDATPVVAQARRAGSRRFRARFRRAPKVRYVMLIIVDQSGATGVEIAKVR